jgi:hypothetical protein
MKGPKATRTATVRALAPTPLPGDLAEDLEAFCAAHYRAEKAEVIRRALRFFIDAKLAAEPEMRARFLEERALMEKRPGAVVRFNKPTESLSPSQPDQHGGD